MAVATVTDGLWERLSRCWPPPHAAFATRAAGLDDRQVRNETLSVLATGIAWDQLPNSSASVRA